MNATKAPRLAWYSERIAGLEKIRGDVCWLLSGTDDESRKIVIDLINAKIKEYKDLAHVRVAQRVWEIGTLQK